MTMVAEKKEIPRELYKCLAYNKMLLESYETNGKINLAKDAVEQWAKEFYWEKYLEKQMKMFSMEKASK